MNAYLDRARRALRTARLTLADGDTIGASNRVYYALFDAVRAVLSSRKLVDLERIRTHHGISHVFTTTVVKTGLLDNEVALVFRKALELRSDADYGSDTDLDREAVEATVQQAATFIDACAKLVEGSDP